MQKHIRITYQSHDKLRLSDFVLSKYTFVTFYEQLLLEFFVRLNKLIVFVAPPNLYLLSVFILLWKLHHRKSHLGPWLGLNFLAFEFPKLQKLAK